MTSAILKRLPANGSDKEDKMDIHLRRRFLAAPFLIALTLSACQTAAPAVVSDRLFFGRNIPAGGSVSNEQWDDFVRAVVTPRFPKGLTIFQGNGQWLDPRGDVVREPVFVIEVFHDRSAAAEASIAAIAAEYKKRFGQDAVLRVTSGSVIRFY